MAVRTTDSPTTTPPPEEEGWTGLASVIPQGLATKVGKYGALVFFAVAVIIYAFDLDVDTEEMFAAGLAGVTLWTMMWGRYRQSEAIYRDAPSPQQMLDASGELDVADVLATTPPAESELGRKYAGDPPEGL